MKELLEKYPKAAKVVKEYYLKKLLDSLEDKGLPDEFKDHVKQQGLPEEQIIKLLESNPIALIDIFDENNIFIHILVTQSKDDLNKASFAEGIFLPSQGTKTGGGTYYKTRKEAEKKAIIEAFKLLEEKL
jgi:hypothetical protein